MLKSLFGIAEGSSITSGPGYLDAELFSFMLPLFVLVLAIGSGARTFAGEEDAGRLELLLSYPIRRRNAVLAKSLAVGTEVLVLCAAAGVAMLVLDPLLGLDLSTRNIAAAVASLAALGLLHGWLALAVGAATASRALAIGVPVGLAAAGYLVNGLHADRGLARPVPLRLPVLAGRLVPAARRRRPVGGRGRDRRRRRDPPRGRAARRAPRPPDAVS